MITEIIDFTGDGAGNTLAAPRGIAVDSLGNVYVAGLGGDNAFKITPCGDGIIDTLFGEVCDDDNSVDGDGCSSTCTVEEGWNCTGAPSTCTEVCGDGMIVGSEECDDGNTDDGDGCSATCTVEPDSTCTGEPSVCITGIPTVSDWGLIIMSLLLLAGGTILIGGGRRPDDLRAAHNR